LDAVVDHLRFSEFTLCGLALAGPTSIAYAAERLERVSHLVLLNTFASGEDYGRSSTEVRAVRELFATAERDWKYFTLTLANVVNRFRDSESTRRLAALYHASMSPQTYLAYMAMLE
jgi:pimeloyl-ACP methyl ester carboxylesterase